MTYNFKSFFLLIKKNLSIYLDFILHPSLGAMLLNFPPSKGSKCKQKLETLGQVQNTESASDGSGWKKWGSGRAGLKKIASGRRAFGPSPKFSIE